MTWLLKLYPRKWRRHYGAEIEEVVASQPKSLRLAIDLLGGAVDAHWKPQAFARRFEEQPTDPSGGRSMLGFLKCCDGSGKITTREGLFGATLTIGSALVVAGIQFFGDSPVTEAISLTMFPGVLVVGTMPSYLRGHSTPARIVLIGGLFLVLFLIGLATGLATR